MEKKHPKHRAIPRSIISHPIYKGMKAASKAPHRYDMREESVVGGLHIFEWIVVGLAGLILFGAVVLGVHTFAIKTGGGGSCTTCG